MKYFPHYTINVKDNSLQLLTESITYPLYRPVFTLKCARGPVGVPVWTSNGAVANALWGEETFDKNNKEYFSRASAFVRRCLQNNGCFIIRLGGNEGHATPLKKAGMVLEASLNTITPGSYNLTYKMRPFNTDESFESLEQAQQDYSVGWEAGQTDNIPVMAFAADNPGVYGNQYGISLSRNDKSFDIKEINRDRPVTYDLGYMYQPNGINSTPLKVPTKYGSHMMTFANDSSYIVEAIKAGIGLSDVLDRYFGKNYPVPVQSTILETGVKCLMGIMSKIADAETDDASVAAAVDVVAAQTVLDAAIVAATVAEATRDTDPATYATAQATVIAAQAVLDAAIAAATADVADVIAAQAVLDAAITAAATAEATRDTDTATYATAQATVDTAQDAYNAALVAFEAAVDPSDTAILADLSDTQVDLDIATAAVGPARAAADTAAVVYELKMDELAAAQEAYDNEVRDVSELPYAKEILKDTPTAVDMFTFESVYLDTAGRAKLINIGEVIDCPVSFRLGNSETPTSVVKADLLTGGTVLMFGGSDGYLNIGDASLDGEDDPVGGSGAAPIYDDIEFVWGADGVFMNPEIVSGARYPFNHIIDTGYPMRVKSAITGMLGHRNDVKPVLTTWQGAPMDMANTVTAAGTLVNGVRDYKESEVHGTSAFQGIVFSQSGLMVNKAIYGKRVPTTFWYMDKLSQMHNRTFIAANPQGDTAYVQSMYDIDWAPYSDVAFDALWGASVNYAQYYDNENLHFASLKSVYEHESSVFVNDSFSNAIVYIKQSLRPIWAKHVGRDQENSVVYEDVLRDLDKKLTHILNGKYKFDTSMYQTESDQLTGFEHHIAINVYGSKGQRIWHFDIIGNDLG